MNHLAKPRKAEADLGRQSKQLAEDECGLVAPDRLAQTITEFVEWRAFSYWLRLIVETQGFVSDPMIAILQERCPGFLDYASAYRQGASTRARVPLASLSRVDRRKTISRFYSRGLAPRAWLLRDSRSPDGSDSGALETVSPGVEASAARIFSEF